jgi:hypothetical protein
MCEDVQKLRAYLDQFPPGKLDGGASVEVRRLLAKCWESFDGSGETKMAGWKLERAKDLEWNPPWLSFCIERHGAASRGSIYAEMQCWSVNLETREAIPSKDGRHPLGPKEKRLDVNALAKEIASLIIAGKEDARLKRSSDGKKVEIRIREVIPETNKETTAKRRKRFREILEPLLAAHDWKPVRPNVYQLSR